MPRFNPPIITHIMGLLLAFNGGFMLTASAVSTYYKEDVTLEIFVAALLTVSAGAVLMFLTRHHQREVKKRDGYFIVSLGWILMALSGTLPYVLTEAYLPLQMLFLRQCRVIPLPGLPFLMI